MLYFTNQELAEANHVSVRTVRNWIEAAREGKVDLTLNNKGERYYIANTSKNLLVIKDLVNKNKKYRPHRSQKIVMPQSKFYELYTQEQIYDIVANLEINHEIPVQYNYFGDGASDWDALSERMAEEEAMNSLKAAVDILELDQLYFDVLLSNYKQINVIDIGVGNALPVKKFLSVLLEQGKLGRYIALDISPSMLEIAKKNIGAWFDGRVQFEGYTLDIEHERFGYLLSDEYIKSNSKDTSNLLLFLGGTIANFRRTGTLLDVIHDSMGVNDYFIHQQKVDSPSNRKYFDYNTNPTNTGIPPSYGYVFKLLNIDESSYVVEMGFDSIKNERYIRVALKIALSIRFSFDTGERIIDLNKGDHILLWRARHFNLAQIISQLSEHDFVPLQLSQHTKIQSVLAISRIYQEQE
jgi:uncharacterized SAM-dependent methyltransferase